MDSSSAGEVSGLALHSFVSLDEFKALLSVDDRDDCLDFASVQNPGHEFLHGKNSANSFQPPSLAAFCLLTATYGIERYCHRRLVMSMNREDVSINREQVTGNNGKLVLYLREYPVREVVTMSSEQLVMSNGEVIGAGFYRVIPDLEEGPEDTIYSLLLSPAVFRGRGLTRIKVVYRAGYGAEEVPPDLAAACLELAAWNMSRYRGRRIGMTGSVRGSGKDGEHLEMSMPENVRGLLEPYKRRMI